MSGLLAGPIIQKYGLRNVAVTGHVMQVLFVAAAAFSPMVGTDGGFILMIVLFGVGVGFSFTLCYSAVLVATNAWFDTQRAFAVGIGSSGAGIGQAAFNILMYELCSRYGWQASLWVWAGIALVCLTPVLFFLRLPVLTQRPTKPPQQAEPVKGDNKQEESPPPPQARPSPLSFFQDPVFVAWFFSLVLASFGYFSPFTHLVKHAQDVGIDEDQAPTLMSIIGACDLSADTRLTPV